jgi:hypothetical protein
LQHLRRCVNLLSAELARSASLYQLNGVLEGCTLVEVVLKGFADHHAGRCVVPTLTSMDLCEYLVALSPGYALHYDTIGATLVDI